VEFFKILIGLMVGNAAVLCSSEIQSEKDFLKNFSVTKSDDWGVLQEF
jgi:hypothetical protein